MRNIPHVEAEGDVRQASHVETACPWLAWGSVTMASRRDDLNRLAADALDAAGLGMQDTDTLILAGAMLEQATALNRIAREVARLREAIEEAAADAAARADD